MKIQKSIIMHVAEHARLDRVIAFGGKAFNRAGGELQARRSELERVRIVATEEIPTDVITLTNYAVHQTG
jgi:hypothetical protein